MRRAAVLVLVGLVGFTTLQADSLGVITLGAPLFVILLGIVAACVVGLIGE
jgi:hypothetical protein